MVQAMVNFEERNDRVLTIVKGKYGFKNKSEANNFVIHKFEENFLEPELRPEFVEKMRKIEKEKSIKFKDINDLRRIIEE